MPLEKLEAFCLVNIAMLILLLSILYGFVGFKVEFSVKGCQLACSKLHRRDNSHPVEPNVNVSEVCHNESTAVIVG